MKCEIHGCPMDYMEEIHGIDQWSCPECVAEEEILFHSEDDDIYLPNFYDEDDMEPIYD